MARVTEETVEEVEAAEAQTETVEVPESPAVESTDGAHAATPTEPTPAEAPAEEVEPDLTAFNEAAEAAIQSGEFEAVNEEYNKLDRKGKAKATSHVNSEIKRNLTETKDKDAAFAWGQLGQALKTVKAKAAKVEKAPVNRTETVVEQLAGLYLAYTTAKGAVKIDGLDENWTEQVKAKIDAVQPEIEALIAHRNAEVPEGTDAPAEPEVSDVAKRAVRLAFQGGATKKAASTGGHTGPSYSGPRRSIAKHISEAFSSHPAGTFLSVAQIRSFESSEYGSDLPSAGAISAAMKSPKWDASEITPGNGGEKGTFGATKG